MRLYAGLGQDGRVRPLRFRADAPRDLDLDPAPPLFGDAARWYVGEVLRAARPPVSLLPDRHRRLARPLAFKTGTSYGFRDAWAIGFNGAYTIGVWVGRPDGPPNPGRFGANAAAPLLFQLFDDLPPADATRPPRPRGALPLDAKLPPGLRLLGEDFAHSTVTSAAPPPRILYPLDETVLQAPTASRPVTLEAEGGAKPLTWLVNGRPIEARRDGRRAAWRPDGAGFNDIVLVDALGRRAAARVRFSGP